MARVTRKRVMMAVGAFICLTVLWGSLRAGTMNSESTNLPGAADIDPANLNRKILETIAINKRLFSGDLETNATLTPKKAPVPAPVPIRRQKVLLTSYMRAGSTLTGDLFQFSPDVFYFYEPLLYHSDVDVGPGKNDTRRKLDSRSTWAALPPDTLAFTYRMLRCDVSVQDFHFLPGLRLSKSTKEFDLCSGRGERIECTIAIRKKCMSYPVILAKVLRLKMYEIDELLRFDPEVKVIHLVRDPRAISVSRDEAHYFFNFLSFCSRINGDALDSAEMQKKYPGRILTIRYEDLADAPVNAAKQMYEFAGVTWTDDVEKMTLDLTAPSNTSFREHKFETRRQNSSKTASKWRTKLDYYTAFGMQSSCETAFQKYGYKSIHDESDLRNMNKPLTLDTFDKAYKKYQRI